MKKSIKKVKIGPLKKKIQIEFNRMIAQGKPCAKSHQIFTVMQCSHVHSIGSYPNLRFDPMNTLPMCGRHHMFWWHLEVSEAWDWFKQNFSGRYEYLLKAKNIHNDWTIDKLLEIRKNIKNRDLKALMILPIDNDLLSL